MPSWKSATQTANIKNLAFLAGNDNLVAAWLGKKADTTNGQLKNPTMWGGLASGTDTSAALAIAVNGTTRRALSEHFADTLNLADFGVVCDGVTDNAHSLKTAFSAVATSPVYSNGVRIIVPRGQCYSSVKQPIIITDGRSVSVSGVGAGVSNLTFGAGGLLISTSGNGAIIVSDLGLIFTGHTSTSTDVALSLIQTNTNSGGNSVVLSNVSISSASRAAGWHKGIYAEGIAPSGNSVRVRLPDYYNGGPTDTVDVDLYGYPGTDANNTGQRAIIDTKWVNSILQGGAIGFQVKGHVEGLWFSNGEILGNGTGVDWDGSTATEPTALAGNLLFSNFHMNTGNYGFKLNSVASVNIQSGLFLVFGWTTDGTRSYTGVKASGSTEYVISGNTFAGNSNSQNVSAIELSNTWFATITGNNLQNTGGNLFIGSTNSLVTVTANIAGFNPSRETSYYSGCGGYTLCSNNIDNGYTQSSVQDNGDVQYGAFGGNVVINPKSNIVLTKSGGGDPDIEAGDRTAGAFAMNVHTSKTGNAFDSRWVYTGGGTTAGAGKVQLLADSIILPSVTTPIANISGALVIPFGTPGSTDPCTQGQMEMDATYLYSCVASGSWHRINNGTNW
ncbi:hypothetical protein GWK89_15145 [Gluconobacter kondonii]|nr:hypothetical protein [Gluconobacter kondonii]